MDSEEKKRDLLVMCEYDGEMHVLTVDDGTSLLDIFHNLCSKWAGIKPSTTTLQYIAPIQKLPVTVISDKDVSNMVQIHATLKMGICDMRATLQMNDVRESRKRR